MQDLKQRFEGKYIPEPNSGCWIWEAFTMPNGYGRIGVGGNKVEYAHRVSYMLHKGEIGDKHVCHHCDVRECVNPDHLFLGTPADNMQDCWKKGRHPGPTPRPSRPEAWKLTPEQVAFIREAPVKGKDVAKQFGVSVSAISMIRSGKRRVAA